MMVIRWRGYLGGCLVMTQEHSSLWRGLLLQSPWGLPAGDLRLLDSEVPDRCLQQGLMPRAFCREAGRMSTSSLPLAFGT